MELNKEIHLLTSFGGRYEDAWTHIVCAGFDKNRMIALCDEKVAELKAELAIQKEFYDFIARWEKINPAPEIPEIIYDHIPVPLLPNREKDILPGMRENKARIKEENDRRRRAATDVAHIDRRAWKSRHGTAVKNFRESKGWPEHIDCPDDSLGYRIETIPFVE